ncbi:MAG: hypothetical protein WCI67_23255, partial [Chloroflexales bacterium]
AQDGTTTKTYTVTVTRAAAAGSASVDLAVAQSYTLTSLAAQAKGQAALAATANHLTLTITVGNRGPDSVTGLVVTDAFPPAVAGTTWSWTCAATGGAACGAASGTGDLNETLGALPKDGAVTFTVIGTLSNPASWSNAVGTTLPSGVVNSGGGVTTSTIGVYRVLLPMVIR